MLRLSLNCCFFFFNDTATTEIYTLSLHDALPISVGVADRGPYDDRIRLLVDLRIGQIPQAALRIILAVGAADADLDLGDRKSTRLNSSHGYISYAVFCLKKKKIIDIQLCLSGDAC